MKPESMDAVFMALSHQARRRMLDLIRDMPGCSIADICKYFDISRIAVMKHLNVLYESQLVISRRVGRRRELFFNPVPIQMIHDRWVSEYSEFWATRALDLKYMLENGSIQSSVSPNTQSKNAPK
jgi:DNA-binding transcriptional ArsR family regulator